MGGGYLSVDKSNKAWEYNFNRARFQKDLGEQYFVPRIFFFLTKKSKEVITISSWTEHIPTIIPPADYFLLTRKYKKFFRTVKDNVLVSRETIVKSFASYLDDFGFEGCKIIQPGNSMKINDKFNAIKAEQTLADFAERLPMEKLYNAKPD